MNIFQFVLSYFILRAVFPAYRLNKYCGQHLIIANELQESDPSPAFPTHRTRSTLHRFETDGDDAAAEEKGEPVAEALIQNDQQFHHLKILKSSDEHAEHVEPIKPIKQKNFAKNRRVYSQVSKFQYTQSFHSHSR